MEGLSFLSPGTSLVAQMVKNLPAMQDPAHGFNPWVGKIPWRSKRLPTQAWTIPQTKVQKAAVHGVTKELHTTE